MQDLVITTSHVEPTYTAVVREKVPQEALARFVPSACGEVWTYARQAGLRTPGRHLAVYLGDGVVECGVEVAAPFTGNSRVVCSQTPGGLASGATHLGPYGLLGRTHHAIRQWCSSHGLIPGMSWELYGHWDPDWDHDPAKIRTDVYYLVDGETRGSAPRNQRGTADRRLP
jgi:hypothetical protein